MLRKLFCRRELERQLNIPNDGLILLSVGEINRNKNHEVIIKALTELKDARVHYLIAGNGKLRHPLEELSKRLGVHQQVHFLGFRNDIAELLSSADVFLLPSIREGLNVSLMEAMACGLPCICSDIRGNRDLIGDGNSEYLVHPKEVVKWKDAIRDMLDRQDALGRFNRFSRTRIMKFSCEAVDKRMREIYQG